MTDLSEKSVGRYQLMERLGQGAMAQVYRAHAPVSDTDVAVKILHSHLTGDEGLEARFRREAQAAASLDHPNIIAVLDYGSDGELSYLVMELVDGPSLKTVLQQRDKPLAPEEAVRLVAALADALEHAHQQGVVHRDVKPSNVLLRDGRLDSPVLTDFGVARMVEATVVTASGTTLGTPTYMAPEQGEGKPGDGRSDVYALGVILYELLTGRPPFDAESPYALILRHIHTPPPSPRTLRPALSSALEAVILRALAKEPEARYPTAAAFAAALRQSLIPATRPRLRSPAPALAAIALLLVLALFVTWRLNLWPMASVTSGEAIAAKATPAVLTLLGGPAIADTWLDPDLPDRRAVDDPKVHLQGPSTPDRLVYRLALPEWPVQTELLTATLSLYTVPWGEDNRYATVTVHRLLRDWDPTTATYATPWSSPGLQADVDYEPEPMTVITLTTLLQSEGWLDLDVTPAVRDWLEGQSNYGLAVRLTDDSFGMAHLWVYAAEYDDPNLRPKLTLIYQQP
jgi:tRNA A-37 threonylcarbamoyl transferase component Bud32